MEEAWWGKWGQAKDGNSIFPNPSKGRVQKSYPETFWDLNMQSRHLFGDKVKEGFADVYENLNILLQVPLKFRLQEH